MSNKEILSVTHIATSESFRFDDMPPTDCVFCNHQTAYFGWCGVDCSTCGASYDCDDFIGWSMQVIRQKLKLSRKELAEILGYAPSTVKKAEFVRVSKPYLKKFKEFVRLSYEQNK